MWRSIASYAAATAVVFTLANLLHIRVYPALVLIALGIVTAIEISSGGFKSDAGSVWRVEIYIVLAYALEMSITQMRKARALVK